MMSICWLQVKGEAEAYAIEQKAKAEAEQMPFNLVGEQIIVDILLFSHQYYVCFQELPLHILSRPI